MENKKITFIGSGIIGSGLAVNAVMHGFNVTVYYRRKFEELRERIRSILQTFSDNAVCTKTQAKEFFGLIEFTMNFKEAVADALLVQESIVERAEQKQEVYKAIQEICGDKTLIASSTSALFPSELSKGMLYPEKIVVGHPYNPAHLLPIMEICGGDTASEETIQAVKEIYVAWGKVPVICRKEVKGFLANQVNWSVTRIGRELVADDVCTVEDFDRALMFGPGLRMAITGQLLTISLGTEGGYRRMSEKYNLPENPRNEILATGIDDMLENLGFTAEEAARERDGLIIKFLKLRGMM